jgi:hypothetical protein
LGGRIIVSKATTSKTTFRGSEQVSATSFTDIRVVSKEKRFRLNILSLPPPDVGSHLNLDDLKPGFAEWLCDNRPQASEYKVERLLRESGHDILWMPCYCPDLQPIKRFWAAGKVSVSDEFANGRKMIEGTIANLRDE